MDQKRSIQSSDWMIVRIWAVSLAVLIALSWKLWVPGFTDFPRVPVFDTIGASVLIFVQYAALLLLIASLIFVCVSDKMRESSVGIAAAFGVFFLCNQHCLQPWAWQGFIIAVLIACLPMRDAKIWIARVLISIYLYSAIGKFDYQFIHSLGQDFLDVVLGWFGQVDSISDQLKSQLVLLFPIGELLVAIGLMFPKSCKAAAWLAIVLHLVLIAILSPFGLNHRWPVVVWNAMSVLFVVWLFLRPKEMTPVERSRADSVAYLGMVFAIVVLVGPLLRPVQLWDHWLAWGLYSPGNSRVETFVSEGASQRCGEILQQYFTESADQFGSRKFAMDRWSLNELGVPIYPQARFQRGASIGWLRQHEILDQATLVEYGPSHPVSGQRTRTPIELPKR